MLERPQTRTPFDMLYNDFEHETLKCMSKSVRVCGLSNIIKLQVINREKRHTLRNQAFPLNFSRKNVQL